MNLSRSAINLQIIAMRVICTKLYSVYPRYGVQIRPFYLGLCGPLYFLCIIDVLPTVGNTLIYILVPVKHDSTVSFGYE